MATLFSKQKEGAWDSLPKVATYSYEGTSSSRPSWFRYLETQYTALHNFFWQPAGRLTRNQRLQLEHRLLQGLARRTTYWVGLLLVASILVLVFGARDPNPRYGITMTTWAIGLWALVIPLAYLVRQVMLLPDTPSLRSIRRLHLLWCALIAIIGFCWLAGNWTLIPQPQFKNPPEFVFAQQTFVFFTTLGQVLTVLLLAPSKRAVLCALVIGIFIPFIFVIRDQLPNPGLSGVWITSHLSIYAFIGLVLVTDQRRNQARGILLEAERSRANHFIAAISHDLRQPLTTVALKLKSLREKIGSPETLTDIQALQQQVIAMETMVNGTLDLSRLEAGTWVVQVREVALQHLVEKVTADLEAEASAKGIQLEVHSLPFVVKTDPLALERILRNLLGNALRYTPAMTKKGPGRVVLECQEQDNVMRISIADNGIGIPGNRLEDVFQEYVQLANPERDRSKGLGLGLSIVQGLADLLGHKLEVQSIKDEGSRFSVLVPIVGRVPLELLGPVAQGNSTPDLTDMVVLLIEDDPGPREALLERLVEWGCYTVDGESAEEVLEKIRDEGVPGGPHFIISDYRLRAGITGISAIETIRQELKLPVPAAIWTAETSPVVLQQVVEKGFDLLSKPPDETVLVRLLNQYKPRRAGSKIETAA